jgi:TATA-box binding protein (TBP) (component of TFIID and TFIIIB)
MQIYASPTSYRISTITATGCVGTNINLDVLYTCLEISLSNESQECTEGIVYVEYGKKKSETVYKGYCKKFSVTRRKVRPTKRFDNQVTIVYKTPTSNYNIKVFRNGNIQVTGIKNIEFASEVVDKMIQILADLYHNKDKTVIDNVLDLKNINFKIRLINTDYKVGFSIKRDILHKILKHEYGLICNFEPVIYPGVKLHYFYNKTNSAKNGICKCDKKCHDTKGGQGECYRDCKKITIAIFQSGCIIITGSQTSQQIDECYQFINNLLYSNVSRIERKTIIPLIEAQESTSSKKVVLIPKSKIQYI